MKGKIENLGHEGKNIHNPQIWTITGKGISSSGKEGRGN